MNVNDSRGNENPSAAAARRPLRPQADVLSGVAVFTAASVLCSATPSLGWLIAGRVAQGIGAAALSPASPASIAAAHPVPR